MTTRKIVQIMCQEDTTGKTIDLFWHVAQNCGVYVNHQIALSSENEKFIMYFIYSRYRRQRKTTTVTLPS